ncbi:uncharacterized protein EDB93DRAFT_1253722 [Suillus bovinus]|uniref:uncharacterized protein n=1 Tax=Suillus bovinus TaxID=48563 RepID=UPI001B85D122|nr:uncharacterized protein EDB93DRAFT_1253722 [Suillus bovinus]KAG2137106.1 hypothetical protein EDB93DRAFT_1253722 [Suillus bovinus]
MPPRTKQTCKKSTGGVAPRVTLNLPGAVSTISRVEVGTVRIEEEERRDHNNFCLVCRDGAVDDYHLSRHVTFVCISCHVLAQHHGHGSQNPYFGFYRDGKPIFDTFLQIRGALELPHQAQVSSETVLFIHLNLIDNDTTGGPFKLSHDFLLPYFPDGGIIFREVIFDIGSDSKIVKFHSMVNKLVLKLLAFPGGWKHIIFGVSDHTDNDFGDPFVGYKGKKKTYISTPVNTFLDIVLGPFKDLINLAVESYLWLFCCGAIVGSSESFKNLKTSVLQHQLSASVAFNAVRFQPSFATHLLLAFIERVVIERFSISHAFPLMLSHSLNLDWTSSFRAILVSYQSKFLAANSKSERSRVIKKIRKAIVVAHKEQGEQVPLPSSLKKAIKKYYGRKNDEEESDEEGAAKAREISARPKEASFYKKMLTDWDVAQRLFKQEMDEFDKAEQARKGVKDPIKFRTCHAREWFNQMSLTQKKEVDYAREKWNTEGAPEESQVMYCKNNLKKVLEDFSEQLHRTMGCHIVMLVSHKKRADQTLNITLHESQPRNVKKSFSVSSDGIKEWTSTGFEFFAEWAKGEFYPTADQDDKEEEEHGLPELILDDEGYAQLPSRDGIRLKGQQELVRMIFHAAYKVFTGTSKPVPWRTITPCPSQISMSSGSIGRVGAWRKKRLVSFIKARPMDMRHSKRDKASSRKVKPYDEVTSEEEQHSLAGLGATLAVVSLAEVPLDRRFEFLDGLSTDSSYLELVDAVKDLAKMTENISTPNEELELPPWVDWCCGESYLPEYLHGSQDMVMASLEVLTQAPIRSSSSGALVVLGLGLILRDCKRVIEYEEDEAPPGTPIYLASSIMDLQCMIKVDNAIRHTLCAIVGLIELAMKATSGDFDEGDQEEMKGVDGENVDKDEDKEEDKDEDEDKDKDEDEEEDKDKDEDEEEDKDKDDEEDEDEEEDEDMEEDKDQDEEDEQEEVTGDLDVQM